jgi:diguanylate cyclase (GGDEF)-like protein
MIRVLIVGDDPAEAALELERMRSAGLPCEGERVATEAEFRASLERPPDLILSDIGVNRFDGLTALSIARELRPGTPFIVCSTSPRPRLEQSLLPGLSAWVPKSDTHGLVSAVHKALEEIGAPLQRASDRITEPESGISDVKETANYLLERQANLERMLHRDDATLSSLLTRTPPTPAALVMIQEGAVRERYLKVLHHAGIEAELAPDLTQATIQLNTRVHALLFTDTLDLVRTVRQLQAGAATHVIFVSSTQETTAEALRAGANDTMPSVARGEQFWPRLSTARRLVSFASSLQSAVTHNRILATLDELTRCGNRRYFEQQFPREVTRAIRMNRPLALLMCDIDGFKVINDQYGHQVGDEVLREIGDRLTHGLRLGEDWVARVGGEEFAIVLPETGRFKALAVAERLRAKVNTTAFQTLAGLLHVTASFGVCGVQVALREISGLREKMIAAADAALYQSKRDGRNRVTAAEPFQEGTGGSRIK